MKKTDLEQDDDQDMLRHKMRKAARHNRKDAPDAYKKDNSKKHEHDLLYRKIRKAASDYHESFPDVLKKLLVIDRQPIYATPKMAEKLKKTSSLIKQAVTKQTKEIKRKRFSGYATRLDAGDGSEFQFLKITLDKKNRSYVSSKHPSWVDLIVLFDHEMGHFLSKVGWNHPSQHRRECAADTFALLRYLQRHSDNEHDIFGYAPYRTAHSFLWKTPGDHYTVACMQKVEKLYKEGFDIKNLSFEETINLAEDIAQNYHQSDATLKRSRDAFEPARKYLETRGRRRGPQYSHEVFVATIVDIMQKNQDDHDVYRVGKMLMMSPENKEFLAKHPGLTKAIDAMAAREKGNGFIFNAAEAIDAAVMEEEKIQLNLKAIEEALAAADRHGVKKGRNGPLLANP